MTLTDDLGLSPEFLADEDIARDDDNYAGACGTPRCGGSRSRYEEEHCPGCRHCDPVDHEAKPYGWGIERFEDPALNEANRMVNEAMERVFGAYSLRRHVTNVFGRMEHVYPALWRAERDRLWSLLSKFDAVTQALSDRVWETICDSCETHTEAVRRYTRWADKNSCEPSTPPPPDDDGEDAPPAELYDTDSYDDDQAWQRYVENR